MSRILVLLTDAFGGQGGIAKYNRDFLKSSCEYFNCSEVVAIPRLILKEPESFPSKLTYVTTGINNKLKYIFTVLKTVRKNPKFDLIICGHIHLIPIAYLLRLWIGVPLILIIYGIEAWNPPKGLFQKYCLKKIDTFISISNITKDRFLAWSNLNNVKSFLLPNAVDMSSYSPGAKNIGLLNKYNLVGKTIIMTLGRMDSFERYKGFDDVLELMPELRKIVSNIHYLVVGDGIDRRRLEEKAENLGIKDYVIFRGYVSEEEKVDYYRLADAFVMPSRGEGFGFVILEAMACGVPVVASKVDGGREAVRDGLLGILVNPENKDEVKNGIIEALGRPKIVPEKLEYFSYKNFEKRCQNIIDTMLKK